MKNLKFFLPAVVLFSTLWFACYKDPFIPGEIKAGVTFFGLVVDESGAGIEGAQVRIGGEIAATDRNGVFILPAVNVSSKDARLSVSKIGYFDFSRAYIVEDGSQQNVTIQLLAKNLIATVNSATGGTVPVPGGGSLKFSANSFVTASGTAFTGDVRVYARYLNPTDTRLPLFMPGDLRAISASGENQTLATFGMMGVEIEGNGSALQIAPNEEAEISMPIQSAQQSVAPAEIALWHFDTDKARWIEEGKAQKVGNQYVGKVKHFSFWNCDAPFPLVYLKGSVFLGNDQTPLANAKIKLTIASNGWKGYGTTNNNGIFQGAVPKDEVMVIEIVDECGSVVFSQNIGPFTSDVTLPAVILNAGTNSVEIKGRLLDCLGQPVVNGFALIEIAGKYNNILAPISQNGEFSTLVLSCSSGSATIIGYDLDNLTESDPKTIAFPPSPADAGDIQVCTTVAEFIQYKLDGADFTILNPGGVYISPRTSLYGDGPGGYINLDFNNNNQTGTYPVNNIYVNGLSTDSLNAVINLNTTVTATGNLGEPIIGTFSGSFQANNGNTHTLSGSYRVNRD